VVGESLEGHYLVLNGCCDRLQGSLEGAD
jgi:hypothetical protein